MLYQVIKLDSILHSKPSTLKEVSYHGLDGLYGCEYAC